MQHETKFLSRVALLMLLFSLQQLTVFACDLCGCFIGVLPYDNQSSFSINHRYRIFSGYPGMSGGMVFPSGAYRLSKPPSVLHGVNQVATSQNDFESYKLIELRGKWFVSPRVELNFILPFAENRSSTNGVKQRIDGLGDATILAGYHLIRKVGDGNFRHRLVVGLGIKLPSGKCNAKTSDGDRISLMMQTGTGSTDGIFYLAYTGGGYNFRWGATGSTKFSGSNKYKEQLTPATSSTAFVGYVLTVKSWKLLPEISAYQEYMRGMYVGNEFEQGTTMNGVLLGPSIDAFWKNLGINLSYQLPVYEQKENYNLESKARISLGLTWSFNQKKFIIDSPQKS